jgi:hypothetical protein
MSVEIILNLESHCIETEAKTRFRELMDRFFSEDDESGELEERISLLRDFIENSDFRLLRSEHPPLAGGCGMKAVVSRDTDGAAAFSIVEAE